MCGPCARRSSACSTTRSPIVNRRWPSTSTWSAGPDSVGSSASRWAASRASRRSAWVPSHSSSDRVASSEHSVRVLSRARPSGAPLRQAWTASSTDHGCGSAVTTSPGSGKHGAAVELASSGVEEPSGSVADTDVMWPERGSVPVSPELWHQDVAERQLATEVQRAQAVVDRVRVEVGVDRLPCRRFVVLEHSRARDRAGGDRRVACVAVSSVVVHDLLHGGASAVSVAQ